jgi:hypothetical protein
MVPAVAIRGEGVVETLWELLTLCYRSLDRNLGLDTRWKISEQEFLSRIFDHVDKRGVALPMEAGPR